MKKVLLTEAIHQNAVEYLKEHFEVIQCEKPDEETIIRQGKQCSGILIRSARITPAIMDAIPTLEVVAKHGMGVDNVDVKYATQKGIQVVNAPLSNLNAVAEHIVTLLLALSKRLVRMDKLLRNGRFSDRTKFQNIELTGKTVGFIGFGKIPRKVLKKLSGFEMQFIAFDPYLKAEDVADLDVRLVEKETVYRTADFVIIHTVLTDATFHLVGEDELAMMKPSAYLINACRGPVVDEKALIRALQEERIGGAGLDVFEQEPPEKDNVLFDMDQVIVSPHNAALCDGALYKMAMDSALGVVEVLEGKKISFPVNQLG